MIVPRNRLLFFVGLVVVPFATLCMALPSATAMSGPIAVAAKPLSWGILGLFVLLVIVDAARALSRLDGVSATGPDVVRFAKDRQGAIRIHINNEKGKISSLKIALALPPEFQSEREVLPVALPRHEAMCHVDWLCTPERRGSYPVDGVYMEAASPMGFWAARAKSPSNIELRVYPNLQQERKNLAALFLNRGGLGIHTQRQVGKGREFEKLREYSPGDSFEDIHWKATAKRGHPITKTYQIERTQEVYVIIDASRLSARMAPAASTLEARPATDEHERQQSQLERFITAALVMGLVAERQGDLFGVLVYDDGIRSFVRAKNGKHHYSACRDALYTLDPEVVTPDFNELCSFIRTRLRRRALLVVLTTLDDPVLAESFAKSVELICRHHLILVNMMAPTNVRPLFSDANVESAGDLYGKLGGHIQWHDLRELERTLHRRGVSFNLVENEKLCTELVTQYITVKQRQLL